MRARSALAEATSFAAIHPSKRVAWTKYHGLHVRGSSQRGRASSRAASLGRQKDSAIMAEETLKETKGRETLKDNVDKKGRKVASAKVRAEEEVYRTIRSYMGGLKYIYNNALRTNQSLKGKISVKITIAPSGRVTTAEMVSSTLDSQELREALVERINKWKFTELKNVEDFTITYTFDFAPVS